MNPSVVTGALGLALLLSAGGCLSEWQYSASDGTKAPGGTVFENKSASSIVVQSAKHDIPCDSPAVAAEGTLDVPWVVQGCGQRLTYRFVTSDHTWQSALIARVAEQ